MRCVPTNRECPATLKLALAVLAAGAILACARLQPAPATEDVQRAMTWCLKKTYSKDYAFPGGNNLFIPGSGSRKVSAQNEAGAAAPPFLYTITSHTTKTADGERWFCYEFTAIGHLDAGDVTFRGAVALVKRDKTWFFRREKETEG